METPAPCTTAPSTRPEGAANARSGTSERDDRWVVCTSSLIWGWTSSLVSGCADRPPSTWPRLLQRPAAPPPNSPGHLPGAFHAHQRPAPELLELQPLRGACDARLVERGVPPVRPPSSCCCSTRPAWPACPGRARSRAEARCARLEASAHLETPQLQLRALLFPSRRDCLRPAYPRYRKLEREPIAVHLSRHYSQRSPTAARQHPQASPLPFNRRRQRHRPPPAPLNISTIPRARSLRLTVQSGAAPPASADGRSGSCPPPSSGICLSSSPAAQLACASLNDRACEGPASQKEAQTCRPGQAASWRLSDCLPACPASATVRRGQEQESANQPTAAEFTGPRNRCCAAADLSRLSARISSCRKPAAARWQPPFAFPVERRFVHEGLALSLAAAYAPPSGRNNHRSVNDYGSSLLPTRGYPFAELVEPCHSEQRLVRQPAAIGSLDQSLRNSSPSLPPHRPGARLVAATASAQSQERRPTAASAPPCSIDVFERHENRATASCEQARPRADRQSRWNMRSSTLAPGNALRPAACCVGNSPAPARSPSAAVRAAATTTAMQQRIGPAERLRAPWWPEARRRERLTPIKPLQKAGHVLSP